MFHRLEPADQNAEAGTACQEVTVIYDSGFTNEEKTNETNAFAFTYLDAIAWSCNRVTYLYRFAPLIKN